MQTAGISVDLLTPSARQRFMQLFAVAARKSVLPWKDVPRDRAQLVLIDQAMADAITSLGEAPCVLFIGNARAEITRNASWVGRLEVNYTLGDLIDVLDRAAVFLLDWEARQKVIASRSRVEVMQAAATAAATPAKQEFLYQLKSWVSMGAPFNTGASIRALALLSREPVSIGQLCTHSGLDAPTAKRLLVELGHRGVLRGVAVQDHQPVVSTRARQPAQTSGLIGRLSRWIRGGGKAA